MVLPIDTNSDQQRQRMAIMEAAISSSLVHKNIVQTHTYSLKPVRDGKMTPAASGSLDSSRQSPSVKSPVSRNPVDAFEVQIVLEFCDMGSLRRALDNFLLFFDDGRVNYLAVLDTAIDIAQGMAHLHSLNILHSDLKVRPTSTLGLCHLCHASFFCSRQ
jgi:serine/threonine protein kinase